MRANTWEQKLEVYHNFLVVPEDSNDEYLENAYEMPNENLEHHEDEPEEMDNGDDPGEVEDDGMDDADFDLTTYSE